MSLLSFENFQLHTVEILKKPDEGAPYKNCWILVQKNHPQDGTSKRQKGACMPLKFLKNPSSFMQILCHALPDLTSLGENHKTSFFFIIHTQALGHIWQSCTNVILSKNT